MGIYRSRRVVGGLNLGGGKGSGNGGILLVMKRLEMPIQILGGVMVVET